MSAGKVYQNNVGYFEQLYIGLLQDVKHPSQGLEEDGSIPEFQGQNSI